MGRVRIGIAERWFWGEHALAHDRFGTGERGTELDKSARLGQERIEIDKNEFRRGRKREGEAGGDSRPPVYAAHFRAALGRQRSVCRV